MTRDIHFIDTHAHLDGEEYDGDIDLVVERAREAGLSRVFVPSIDLPSVDRVLAVCRRYPGFALPMIGLHPEEVRGDWQEVLDSMETRLEGAHEFIAIGEIGLDYYWSREFEREQLSAFARQVEWAIDRRLPLMIHCRKAQQEMVRLLRSYGSDLPPGVFHCFTGNEHEAAELLSFERFALGIGGVLTFKRSRLPETLAAAVPLDRIVIETDSPYMAPVPLRGKRNESAYAVHVLDMLATVYGVDARAVAAATNDTVRRIFGV